MFTVSSFNIKKPAFLTETLPQLKDQLKSTFSQPILASLHSIKRKAQQFQDEQQLIYLQVGNKVWEGVPRNMRSELWLSVLQRKDAGGASEAVARYEEMLASDVKPITATDIDKDVPRTFPNTKKFHSQEGQMALRRVLRAYAAYDPDVGYCQGMNFLAGLLLLQLTEEQAFGALVVIMFERGFRLLYQHNMSLLQVQLWQLGQLMPYKLRNHLESCGVVPVLFAAPWLMTCYSADFPISFSSRVLDMVLSNYMMSPLLRVAVVLLKKCERKLRTLPDMEDILMFLKLEVPAWDESELHEILSDAFSKDWHDRHKVVLGNTDGVETIAQAMARVHVQDEPAQEEPPAIGTMVSSDGTTESEAAPLDAAAILQGDPVDLPTLNVRLTPPVDTSAGPGSAQYYQLLDGQPKNATVSPASQTNSCFSFSDIECLSRSAQSPTSEHSPSSVHSPQSDFWDPYLTDLRLFTMGEITELRNLSFSRTLPGDGSNRASSKAPSGLARSRSASAHCSMEGFLGSECEDDEDDAAFFEVASRSGSITSFPSRGLSAGMDVAFPMSPGSAKSSPRNSTRHSKTRNLERSSLGMASCSADSNVYEAAPQDLASRLASSLAAATDENPLANLADAPGTDHAFDSPRSADSILPPPSARVLLNRPSFSCMSEAEVLHSRAFPSAASLAMCMAAGSAVAEAIALNRAANASVTSSVGESDMSMFTVRESSMLSANSQTSSQGFFEGHDVWPSSGHADSPHAVGSLPAVDSLPTPDAPETLSTYVEASSGSLSSVSPQASPSSQLLSGQTSLSLPGVKAHPLSCSPTASTGKPSSTQSFASPMSLDGSPSYSLTSPRIATQPSRLGRRSLEVAPDAELDGRRSFELAHDAELNAGGAIACATTVVRVASAAADLGDHQPNTVATPAPAARSTDDMMGLLALLSDTAPTETEKACAVTIHGDIPTGSTSGALSAADSLREATQQRLSDPLAELSNCISPPQATATTDSPHWATRSVDLVTASLLNDCATQPTGTVAGFSPDSVLSAHALEGGLVDQPWQSPASPCGSPAAGAFAAAGSPLAVNAPAATPSSLAMNGSATIGSPLAGSNSLAVANVGNSLAFSSTINVGHFSCGLPTEALQLNGATMLSWQGGLVTASGSPLPNGLGNTMQASGSPRTALQPPVPFMLQGPLGSASTSPSHTPSYAHQAETNGSVCSPTVYPATPTAPVAVNSSQPWVTGNAADFSDLDLGIRKTPPPLFLPMRAASASTPASPRAALVACLSGQLNTSYNRTAPGSPNSRTVVGLSWDSNQTATQMSSSQTVMPVITNADTPLVMQLGLSGTAAGGLGSGTDPASCDLDDFSSFLAPGPATTTAVSNSSAAGTLPGRDGMSAMQAAVNASQLVQQPAGSDPVGVTADNSAAVKVPVGASYLSTPVSPMVGSAPGSLSPIAASGVSGSGIISVGLSCGPARRRSASLPHSPHSQMLGAFNLSEPNQVLSRAGSMNKASAADVAGPLRSGQSNSMRPSDLMHHLSARLVTTTVNAPMPQPQTSELNSLNDAALMDGFDRLVTERLTSPLVSCHPSYLERQPTSCIPTRAASVAATPTLMPSSPRTSTSFVPTTLNSWDGQLANTLPHTSSHSFSNLISNPASQSLSQSLSRSFSLSLSQSLSNPAPNQVSNAVSGSGSNATSNLVCTPGAKPFSNPALNAVSNPVFASLPNLVPNPLSSSPNTTSFSRSYSRITADCVPIAKAPPNTPTTSNMFTHPSGLQPSPSMRRMSGPVEVTSCVGSSPLASSSSAPYPTQTLRRATTDHTSRLSPNLRAGSRSGSDAALFESLVSAALLSTPTPPLSPQMSGSSPANNASAPVQMASNAGAATNVTFAASFATSPGDDAVSTIIGTHETSINGNVSTSNISATPNNVSVASSTMGEMAGKVGVARSITGMDVSNLGAASSNTDTVTANANTPTSTPGVATSNTIPATRTPSDESSSMVAASSSAAAATVNPDVTSISAGATTSATATVATASSAKQTAPLPQPLSPPKQSPFSQSPAVLSPTASQYPELHPLGGNTAQGHQPLQGNGTAISVMDNTLHQPSPPAYTASATNPSSSTTSAIPFAGCLSIAAPQNGWSESQSPISTPIIGSYGWLHSPLPFAPTSNSCSTPDGWLHEASPVPYKSRRSLAAESTQLPTVRDVSCSNVTHGQAAAQAADNAVNAVLDTDGWLSLASPVRGPASTKAARELDPGLAWNGRAAMPTALHTIGSNAAYAGQQMPSNPSNGPISGHQTPTDFNAWSPAQPDRCAQWQLEQSAASAMPATAAVSSSFSTEHNNVPHTLVSSHPLQASIHPSMTSLQTAAHGITPHTGCLATPFAPMAALAKGSPAAQPCDDIELSDPLHPSLSSEDPTSLSDGALADRDTATSCSSLAPSLQQFGTPASQTTEPDTLPSEQTRSKKGATWNHVLHVNVSTSPVQDTIFSMSPGNMNDSPDPTVPNSLGSVDPAPTLTLCPVDSGAMSDCAPPLQGQWFTSAPAISEQPVFPEPSASPDFAASSYQSVDSFILVSPPPHVTMRNMSRRGNSPNRERGPGGGAAMFAALHARHRPKKSLDSQILDQLNGFQANCSSFTEVTCSPAVSAAMQPAVTQPAAARKPTENVEVLNERLSAFLSDVAQV